MVWLGLRRRRVPSARYNRLLGSAAAQLPPLLPPTLLRACALRCCRWVEQDPLAIWRSVQDAVAQCLQAATQQHGPLTVVAVGITNQREPLCC